VAATTLHAGSVVRDEEPLTITSAAPAEDVALELVSEDAASTYPAVRLGSIRLTGRAHVFDSSDAAPQAVFGGAIQLMTAQLEPTAVHGGDKLTVKLRWRAGAPLAQAYKVFVHVLDPSGQRVVAQRDAEPQDGKAPTTSWVIGEVIDDEYAITPPSDIAAGEYPVEIGIYDPRSGDRLTLDNGDNHLVLTTPVRVSR
jgi:hypothetical protein